MEALDLRRAAADIEALGPEGSARIARLARRGRLAASVVPARLRGRLQEILADGGSEALRSAREAVPCLLRRLLELSAVTSSHARVLTHQLDVLTLADLEQALDAGDIANALGTDVERGLTRAAGTLALEQTPLVLGRAWDLLESLLTSMASASPALPAFTPAGDVRRFEPFVSALVLLAPSEDPATTLDVVCSLPDVAAVFHRGPRRSIIGYHGSEIDIRVTQPTAHGTALFTTTGSRAHVTRVVRRHATSQACADETAVYASAGLPFVAPELRHDSGEIEAAALDRLPRLVTRQDIRGDLHMHSTYSDGRDTVEAMVRECQSIGHEYVAITDHSERAAASRTLGPDDIARQREEIERVRRRFPRIQILHGVEVDILSDGRLDFDDRTLERFDIVLASLHERAGQDGRRLTERVVAALRHPLVTIFTHPQNRIPGQRGSYPLDFDTIYAVAAETGTALEVDGAPGHLDLDGEHARAAVLAGATLAIDSDCHRARSLERQMRLGVGTARRGWVEPPHVLNTRSIDEVRAFIARKRATSV
jgi:DNA polymerase (family 10)